MARTSTVAVTQITRQPLRATAPTWRRPQVRQGPKLVGGGCLHLCAVAIATIASALTGHWAAAGHTLKCQGSLEQGHRASITPAWTCPGQRPICVRPLQAHGTASSQLIRTTLRMLSLARMKKTATTTTTTTTKLTGPTCRWRSLPGQWMTRALPRQQLSICSMPSGKAWRSCWSSMVALALATVPATGRALPVRRRLQSTTALAAPAHTTMQWVVMGTAQLARPWQPALLLLPLGCLACRTSSSTQGRDRLCSGEGAGEGLLGPWCCGYEV